MKFFDTEQVIAMGERIRDARTKSGLTQRQVADELGITSEMVIRMEKGKSGCKTDHIFILCQLFKISADHLLYGKEETEEQYEILSKPILKDKISDLLLGATDFEIDKIYRMIQLMLEQQSAWPGNWFEIFFGFSDLHLLRSSNILVKNPIYWQFYFASVELIIKDYGGVVWIT